MERSVKFSRTQFHATRIIYAILDLDGGNNQVEEWTNLRNAMVSDKELNEFWHDEKFKFGFYLVCKATDLAIINEHSTDNTNKQLCMDFAELFLSDSVMSSDGDYKATLKIIDAIAIITKNKHQHDFKDEDLNDFKIIFKTIADCQLMVLEAAKEDY